MPVAKARAVNGRITSANSVAAPGGLALGRPAVTATNSGLVDAPVGAGAGGNGSRVVLSDGSAPRLAPPPSSGTSAGGGGCSWLPALSVARARNVYDRPAVPW